MGWFGDKKTKNMEAVPSLPELPRLPELPKLRNMESYSDISLPQLPSYPNSSFGEKFSQNAIKDAVSGDEEDENEEANADESMPKKSMMMQRPQQKKNVTREITPRENFSAESQGIPGMRRTRSIKPVFVRLDKFEEGMETLEKAKMKISEIEKTISDMRRIREEEEKDLQEWENEIQTLKGHFERIDREIFSKIE